MPRPTETTTAAVPALAEAAPLGRLPADVRPTRYALALKLDPEQPRFSGTAEIALHLDTPRSILWLHGRDLHVTHASLELASGERLPGDWAQVDPEGVARVTLQRPAGPGAATLRISYDAPFDPQLVGVYRARAAGRGYVFSKFEATYARRAFPCFDEPDRKAPFELTLTIPRELEAIANMPELQAPAAVSIAANPAVSTGSAPARGGTRTVSFARTLPLPTYLVAFAVGQFDLVESTVAPSVVRSVPLPLRGVAVRGNGPKLGYALREAAAAISEMERYFGIPFPYPKLDLIAIPDFQSGAMENAGAITFRDQLLLLDEATASLDQRVSITSVVTHELAHQWFGDLVTMEWWDDLWLNEGFATWMATRTMSVARPEMQPELDAVESAGFAMDLDELVSARKIRQPILSTHDITNAFDGITYQKGAAILAMFDRWVGGEKFRLGLQQDLRAHLNGNATTSDLLAALTTAAGRDLAAPFGSFLDQPGVPLIEVRVLCENGQGALSLRQSRTLPVGSAGSRDSLWQVPVCARFQPATGPARESCTLLTGREGRMPLEGGCPSWVLPNAAASGYYRWALDAKSLAALRDVGYRNLSTTERISVAQNLKSAFRSGALPAAEVLAALEPVARDEHGSVAEQPMGTWAFVHDELADARLRERIEAAARDLYAPALKDLGWRSAPADPAERRAFRAGLIRFLALSMNQPEVRREAARLGRAYIGAGASGAGASGAGASGAGASGAGASGAGAWGAGASGAVHPEAVEPDLVPVALAAAVIEGDAAFFDSVVARLVESEDSELRGRLLGALGSVRDPALLQRALALGLDQRLRQNERSAILATALRQPATREAAWTWMKQGFDALSPLLPDRYAGFLLLGLSFCDTAHAEEARAFFAPRVEKINGGPRNLATALENMQLCAARAQAQGDSARSYFAAK